MSPGDTIERPVGSCLELQGVGVARSGEQVLSGVDLAVAHGEILGLIAVQGPGKSTLLRTMAGLLPPTSGRVLFEGKDVYALSFGEELDLRARTAYVFQQGGLLVNTTVYDNVALPLRYHRNLSRDAARPKVDEVLDLLGVLDVKDRFPYELSLGKQKLVSLARALVRDPEVVFYDGFFEGMESFAWRRVTKVIRHRKNNRYTTFVLVMEADIGLIEIADRLAVLEDGRVAAVGTLDALRASDNPRIKQLFAA